MTASIHRPLILPSRSLCVRFAAMPWPPALQENLSLRWRKLYRHSTMIASMCWKVISVKQRLCCNMHSKASMHAEAYA